MIPDEFSEDDIRRLKVFLDSPPGKWLLEAYPAQKLAEMTNELWATTTEWERVKELRAERAGLLMIPEIGKAALRPIPKQQNDL